MVCQHNGVGEGEPNGKGVGVTRRERLAAFTVNAWNGEILVKDNRFVPEPTMPGQP